MNIPTTNKEAESITSNPYIKFAKEMSLLEEAWVKENIVDTGLDIHTVMFPVPWPNVRKEG